MINAFVFALVALGIALSFVRVVLGPTMSDRVVGLDTANVIITGALALIAHAFNNALYLDIAIVYGILAFLETVIIARYLEGAK